MNTDAIRRYCERGALRWTNHVLVRAMQRNISIADIETALKNGTIIEQYPADYPYPSCLVLGFDMNKKHMHIVCGDSGTELWLITAYFPSIDEWTDDFTQRKEPQK